jgi:hypothetical protein
VIATTADHSIGERCCDGPDRPQTALARLQAKSARAGYLTEVDHHDHEALVALDPRTDEALGVARFVGSGDVPVVAKVAVAVVDDRQGRGSAPHYAGPRAFWRPVTRRMAWSPEGPAIVKARVGSASRPSPAPMIQAPDRAIWTSDCAAGRITHGGQDPYATLR